MLGTGYPADVKGEWWETSWERRQNEHLLSTGVSPGTGIQTLGGLGHRHRIPLFTSRALPIRPIFHKILAEKEKQLSLIAGSGAAGRRHRSQRFCP